RARGEKLEICPEGFIRNASDLQVQLLFRHHYIVILFPQIAIGYEGIADETQAWCHNANFTTRLQHANPLLYRRFDFAPWNVLDAMYGKNLVERVVPHEIKMSKIRAILKIGQRRIRIEVFKACCWTITRTDFKSTNYIFFSRHCSMAHRVMIGLRVIGWI